jgi:hypothetical protein
VSLKGAIEKAKGLMQQYKEATEATTRLEQDAIEAAADCNLVLPSCNGDLRQVGFMPAMADSGDITLGICLNPRADVIRDRHVPPTAALNVEAIRRLQNYLSDLLGDMA